jgi:hypothetical protein
MQKTGDVVYQCEVGEVVTLKFVNHNTDMRITYRFEDEQMGRAMQGNSFNFTMGNTMRILRVFFHFINESGTGGSYDVALSGSSGGVFPDPPPELQAGDFVPFRRYVFVL